VGAPGGLTRPPPARKRRHLGLFAQQKLHEPLLIRGLDGEDVDERDEFGVLGDRGHPVLRASAAEGTSCHAEETPVPEASHYAHAADA
jgi:hypothetical protein